MLEICVILSGMEKLCWLSPRAEDFWVRWELNTGESLVWAVHSEDQGWPHAFVAEIPSESPGDTCCSLRCHLWLMESLKREIVGSCESVPGKYYCSSPYSCCSSLTCSTHGWTGFWAEQTFRLAQDNVCVFLECVPRSTAGAGLFVGGTPLPYEVSALPVPQSEEAGNAGCSFCSGRNVKTLVSTTVIWLCSLGQIWERQRADIREEETRTHLPVLAFFSSLNF